MARQFPVLEATRPGLVKKVKPLYRVAERETAAYCVLKGIDYVVEECPLVAGNTQMRHKDTLNQMEEARTDLGQKLLVLRPTLADWVPKMPAAPRSFTPRCWP
jgi:tRNA(Ile)-lysidine synthase TilS/MesJ